MQAKLAARNAFDIPRRVFCPNKRANEGKSSTTVPPPLLAFGHDQTAKHDVLTNMVQSELVRAR